MLDPTPVSKQKKTTENVVEQKKNWTPYVLTGGGILALVFIYFSVNKQKDESPEPTINNQLERDPFHMV